MRRYKPRSASPFRCFNSSLDVNRLVMLMYVRFPLSLRNVEDLLAERGIDLCHETVGFWWKRFGPLFAADIRCQRISAMRGFRHWRWYLDEVFVKVNGEANYLWRAVEHEGEVLESYVTKTRDKQAALRFMRKALKRHGSPDAITTDGLRSYQAAIRELGMPGKQDVGRHADPTKRVGDAPVPPDEEPAEVRVGPRQPPQPLRRETPSRRPSDLKGPLLSRFGRVAELGRLENVLSAF